MNTATLDILERASVPPAQARAIAEVIDIEIDAMRAPLATKSDLTDLRHSLRAESRDDLHRVRDELKAENAKTRDELRSENAKFRDELKAENAKIRDELKEANCGLKVEIHARHADAIRWLFLVILGQTTVLLGAGYFFFHEVLQ